MVKVKNGHIEQICTPAALKMKCEHCRTKQILPFQTLNAQSIDYAVKLFRKNHKDCKK